MSDKPVERFDLGYSFYDCPEMQSSETGGYVEFAAYEALKAENEKLEAHYEGALDSIREHQQICNALKAENEELKEENRLLKGVCEVSNIRKLYSQEDFEDLQKENAELQESVAKGVTWFSVLSQIAVLLDLPDDKPIPSGALEGMMNLKAKEAIAIEHLTKVVEEINHLMNNGDIAPWASLLRGGQFEAWLSYLSDAAEFVQSYGDDKKGGE